MFHLPAIGATFGQLAAIFLGYVLGRRILRLKIWQSAVAAAAMVVVWLSFALTLSLPTHPGRTVALSLATSAIAVVILICSSGRPPTQPPPLPPLARKAHIIFGSLLCLWPILTLLDAFAFDNRSASARFEHLREGWAYLYLCYPLFYGVSVVLSRIALNLRRRRACIYLALLPSVSLLAEAFLLLPIFIPYAVLQRLHMN